jgi:hypothetical protein
MINFRYVPGKEGMPRDVSKTSKQKIVPTHIRPNGCSAGNKRPVSCPAPPLQEQRPDHDLRSKTLGRLPNVKFGEVPDLPTTPIPKYVDRGPGTNNPAPRSDNAEMCRPKTSADPVPRAVPIVLENHRDTKSNSDRETRRKY